MLVPVVSMEREQLVIGLGPVEAAVLDLHTVDSLSRRSADGRAAEGGCDVAFTIT